ncbi:MAG: hypothetical protein M1816_005001 [Peltula sp. TS41687]|nr:MAG: hypothetical protein M1816_005001 [Peltula sp. TS41687]
MTGTPDSIPAPQQAPFPEKQALTPQLPAAKPFPIPIPTNADALNAAPRSSSKGTRVKDNGYRQTCLDHHNRHRANHSAPPIAWNSELEQSARVVARTCLFKHQMDVDGGGYGQNIAARSPGAISASEVAKVVSDQFYNGEVELYPGYGSEPDMSNFHAWGHFSQIVWVDSTHVACVTEDCTAHGLGHFTVCHYRSPGNFGGRYAENVLPPENAAILHG